MRSNLSLTANVRLMALLLTLLLSACAPTTPFVAPAPCPDDPVPPAGILEPGQAGPILDELQTLVPDSSQPAGTTTTNSRPAGSGPQG